MTHGDPARTSGCRVMALCAAIVLFGVSAARGQVVYATDFDGLSTGVTQPFPGAAGHDGWFSQQAVAPAYGEIEGAVAVAGNALHEFTGIGNPSGQQTIDRRLVTSFSLSDDRYIRLRTDFQARSSDLQTRNIYFAKLVAAGGPHPGYVIIQFTLDSGNGEVKEQDGVDVSVIAFNGVDNHIPIPLTVGQDLAWGTWHHLELLANQNTGNFVHLMVNGASQDLTQYLLPRAFDGDSWEMGQQIDEISAQITPSDSFSDETDDDVYWDNLELVVALFMDGFETGNTVGW